MTSLPTSLDPVKATVRTSGCVTSEAPAVSPKPLTTLSTPGGNPASSASSAMRMAVSGVCSAGLMTTALPAARAGPSFQAEIIRGKFQGTIAPTTPKGSRRV